MKISFVNIQTAIIILLFVFLAALFTGCSRLDSSVAKTDTPEAAIRTFYRSLVHGDYDKAADYLSRDLQKRTEPSITHRQWSDNIRYEVYRTSVKYRGIEILERRNVEGEVMFWKIALRGTLPDGREIRSVEEVLTVKEGLNYAVLPSMILDELPVSGSYLATTKYGAIGIESIKAYRIVDGLLVTGSLRWHGKFVADVGAVRDREDFVVTTERGKWSTSLDNFVRLNPNRAEKVELTFKGARGIPLALGINNLRFAAGGISGPGMYFPVDRQSASWDLFN